MTGLGIPEPLVEVGTGRKLFLASLGGGFSWLGSSCSTSMSTSWLVAVVGVGEFSEGDDESSNDK